MHYMAFISHPYKTSIKKRKSDDTSDDVCIHVQTNNTDVIVLIGKKKSQHNVFDVTYAMTDTYQYPSQSLDSDKITL